METIETLLERGVVAWSRSPAGNPAALDRRRFSLGLVATDPPAPGAALWTAASRALKLEAAHGLLVTEPRHLRVVLAAFRADSHYIGGPLGAGFREHALPLLDECAAPAWVIGAASYIEKASDGKLRGENAEGVGFAESIRLLMETRGWTIDGSRVVIIGAASTAAAIAFAFADRGARVTIVNRTLRRSFGLAKKINVRVGRLVATAAGEEEIGSHLDHADVVINASEKGSPGELQEYCALAPAAQPPSEENVRANLEAGAVLLRRMTSTVIVADVAGAMRLTPLLRLAREAGYWTHDPVLPLVAQTAEAFWRLHERELATRRITKRALMEIIQAAARPA